jgi:hypothetical protein
MVIRPRLNLNNGPRNWSANLRTNINILYASGSALLNHKIHSFVRRDNFSIKSRPICHIPPVNKPFRFAAKCSPMFSFPRRGLERAHPWYIDGVVRRTQCNYSHHSSSCRTFGPSVKPFRKFQKASLEKVFGDQILDLFI